MYQQGTSGQSHYLSQYVSLPPTGFATYHRVPPPYLAQLRGRAWPGPAHTQASHCPSA